MTAMFLSDLVDLRCLLDLLDRLDFRQDGLQLLHCLEIERGREPEIHRVSDCIRDLHNGSLNLFQFQ